VNLKVEIDAIDLGVLAGAFLLCRPIGGRHAGSSVDHWSSRSLIRLRMPPGIIGSLRIKSPASAKPVRR
jgi:hypothetical protein